MLNQGFFKFQAAWKCKIKPYNTDRKQKMSDFIIYNSPDGKVCVSLLQDKESVWLSQNQLVEFFDTFVLNVAIYIKNILEDNELDENSVIKDYLITATKTIQGLSQNQWAKFFDTFVLNVAVYVKNIL